VKMMEATMMKMYQIGMTINIVLYFSINCFNKIFV
jgi:hypothetical protein